MAPPAHAALHRRPHDCLHACIRRRAAPTAAVKRATTAVHPTTAVTRAHSADSRSGASAVRGSSWSGSYADDTSSDDAEGRAAACWCRRAEPITAPSRGPKKLPRDVSRAARGDESPGAATAGAGDASSVDSGALSDSTGDGDTDDEAASRRRSHSHHSRGFAAAALAPCPWACPSACVPPPPEPTAAAAGGSRSGLVADAAPACGAPLALPAPVIN